MRVSRLDEWTELGSRLKLTAPKEYERVIVELRKIVNGAEDAAVAMVQLRDILRVGPRGRGN